jgi:hypothetical protein
VSSLFDAPRAKTFLRRRAPPGMDMDSQPLSFALSRHRPAGKAHQLAGWAASGSAGSAANRLSLNLSELEGRMRIVVLVVSLILLGGCNQEPEVTGSTNSKCATDLFPSFDSKNLNQCVAVCMKCEHGVMTTCSTACKLRGAE